MAPNENIQRAQRRGEIDEVRENDPRRRHQTLAEPVDRPRKDHSLDEPVDEQQDIDEEHDPQGRVEHCIAGDAPFFAHCSKNKDRNGVERQEICDDGDDAGQDALAVA